MTRPFPSRYPSARRRSAGSKPKSRHGLPPKSKKAARLDGGKAMTKKVKGRDRWHGATPKTTDSQKYTVIDPLAGWFSLAKSSRINCKQKRGWQKRGRR